MDAPDVLALLGALEDRGIRAWLDGGWGVDCLLGEQTRSHSDVDLVVARGDLARVRTLLSAQGFEETRDLLPTALAFRDARGREVDLHLVDPTPDGGGDQVLEGGGTFHYDPPVEGTVAGRPVMCASAEQQVLMHQGYDLRPVDVEDLRRLAERFGTATAGGAC